MTPRLPRIPVFLDPLASRFRFRTAGNMFHNARRSLGQKIFPLARRLLTAKCTASRLLFFSSLSPPFVVHCLFRKKLTGVAISSHSFSATLQRDSFMYPLNRRGGSIDIQNRKEKMNARLHIKVISSHRSVPIYFHSIHSLLWCVQYRCLVGQ